MNRTSSHSSQVAGFTLVELMISIALVLLLVIGINQVFSLTSKTVGAGQASSAAQRDMRGASKVMRDDFSNSVISKAPCFIIYSRRQWAFRNKQDQLTDRDGDVTTQDIQNTGVNPEPTLPAAMYNNRSHRVDLVKFFARGQYSRQTGDFGAFVSTTSSREAWIQYGHGQLPDNSQLGAQTYDSFNYRDPGPSAAGFVNPNNLYASQWMLTRQAMLLVQTPDTIQDKAYFMRTTSTTGLPPDLTPIAGVGKVQTVGTANFIDLTPFTHPDLASPEITQFNGTPYLLTPRQYPVESGRLDIANTTIDQLNSDFAQRIRFYEGNGQPIWYRYDNRPGAGLHSTSELLYRTQCNPYITRTPGVGISSQGVAQTTPQFVTGCTQFIVEFAGDFISQDNDPASATYGQVLHPAPAPGFPTGNGNQPDGVLDYYVPQSGPNAGTRQIRWYGFPRDPYQNSPSDLGTIKGYNSGIAPNLCTNNDLDSVVPLRDILATGGWPPAKFEREFNGVGDTLATPNQDPSAGSTKPIVIGVPKMNGGGDYAGTTSLSYSDLFSNTSLPPDSSYLCVWEFGGPQMIRIIMTVEDPNGRMAQGQTFEYVFTLNK